MQAERSMMHHVEELLNRLSGLRLDVQNSESNEHLLLKFSEATDALAAYIADQSEERELLEEFKDVHNSVLSEHETRKKIQDAKIEELQAKLRESQRRHDKLKEELHQLKAAYQAKFEGQDSVAAMQRAIEMTESMHQWQREGEKANAELQQWNCKLAMLEEKEEMDKESQMATAKKNMLLYEFLSSALNIAIVGMKGPNVDLVLMSESKDRTDQTWHRLTVNVDECDQRTTDYLWKAIEKTFDREPIEPHSDNSVETYRMGP